MSNLRIITPNDGDAATLSASPALVATLPQANLQDVSRAKVARTTSTALQYYSGTWTTPRIISAAAIVRHNLTSAATWRLLLYSDAALTAVVYDSGNVVACPPKALGDIEWGVDALGASLFSDWALAFSSMFFSPTTAQGFIIAVTDAANPAGYFEISRLFMGRYLSADYNFDWGFGLQWIEDTTQQRTDGGTLRSDASEPRRRMSFRLSALSASDRPKALEWARKSGLRLDSFISLFPADATALGRDCAMAGKLTSMPNITGDFVGNFSGDFMMEES